MFYRRDVYSFFEQDEDTQKMRSSYQEDYRQSLLEFEVDELGHKALGMWWKWDKDAKPVWFGRVE